MRVPSPAAGRITETFMAGVQFYRTRLVSYGVWKWFVRWCCSSRKLAGARYLYREAPLAELEL